MLGSFVGVVVGIPVSPSATGLDVVGARVGFEVGAAVGLNVMKLLSQAKHPSQRFTHVHLISHESILLPHHHLQVSIVGFALIVGSADGTLLGIMDSVGDNVGQKVPEVVNS